MRKNIESLGRLIQEKRGKLSYRDAAVEVGIGHATLARLEKGFVPDISTLNKVCKWLGKNPDEILGYNSSTTPQKTTLTVSAHFRTNNPDPKTVEALASMILKASSMQPKTSIPDPTK